jgi:quinol monooxygenase YgiN
MAGLSVMLRTGLVVAVFITLLVPAAGADSEPNPIVAEVKKALKDPAKPFTMVVHLQVKEGMQGKFEAAFAKAIKGTRTEKGALAYNLDRDIKDPTHFQVYERWKSLADLDEHLKTKHITALLAELKELLSAPPEVKVFLPAAE